MKCLGRILASAALGAGLLGAKAAPLLEGETLFAVRVFPLLQTKCLPCHGDDQDKLKGSLDLRTLAGAFAGGDSGQPALVPGQPAQSPLYLAALRTHRDWEPMPPKEKDGLAEEQLGWLENWIRQRAPWPDPERARELAASWDGAKGFRVSTSGGLSPDWTNRRYDPEDLWAYQPLRMPPLPALKSGSADRPAHPIDLFLAAHWQPAQKPAPLADRGTLIRRVTFDLIGLPPTPKEVGEFLADPSPDAQAFARVVERLLASPKYGEQWGRHWLDVTRYADSSGLANDFERGNAWRYRDYVIRAFNTDKPYDQFMREQLAGDEIDPADPERLVAVGFLRLGPWELTGMEVPKVARQRFLDDVTDSVGQVFLAHPLQCARCHDHKVDPIPTRDYYSMQAVFGTTQLAERSASFLEIENTAGFEEQRYLEQRREEFQQTIQRLAKKTETAAKEWCAQRGLEYISRPEGLRREMAEDQLPPQHAGLTVEDLGMERIARKGLEHLRWAMDRYEPVAFSVYSGRTPALAKVTEPLRLPKEPLTRGELEQTCILTGGSPFAAGERVQPGALSALASLNPNLPSLRHPSAPSSEAEWITGRRLALADWIASPRNPLPARVMVNRIWLWHFGRGLGGNPNNFGATGKKPTHPQLLDWLAATFINQGWSIKALHRLILSSQAYQRASGPGFSQYLAFEPRRLAAEELRDAMLSVSGELTLMLGGIPSRPEINLTAALQPRQVMGTFATAWVPHPDPAWRHRRSIYTLRLRGLPDPFMEVFNQPNSDLSCEARDSSTVTPQVFGLFNGRATHARALAFAHRLIKETTSDSQAISTAFQFAYSRPAEPEELAACLHHWAQMTERHRTLHFEPFTPPLQIDREAVEENTGEKFSFRETLHAYADFIPDPQLADTPPKTRGLAEVCLILFNSNEFVYVY